jgi:hypothetical protein
MFLRGDKALLGTHGTLVGAVTYSIHQAIHSGAAQATWDRCALHWTRSADMWNGSQDAYSVPDS